MVSGEVRKPFFNVVERTEQSALQHSALFALRQLRKALMAFQTIDLNVRTSQELVRLNEPLKLT